MTCAHAAGVIMEPDDWPYVVSITCHRHQSRSSSAVSSRTGAVFSLNGRGNMFEPMSFVNIIKDN